jgi:1-acyl-sn-glycerol-3-phosphate acyltransferase
VPASFGEGIRVLQRNGLLVVFPEGEGGSFKPSSQAYRLQPFRAGLVRLAAETQAPIVPCVITGAEETHVNLGVIDFKRAFKGLKFPIPLNLLAPLPAKWRIRFLPPLQLESLMTDAERDSLRAGVLDEAQVAAISERLRQKHQEALDRELAARPYVFLKPVKGRPSDRPSERQNLPVQDAA